MSEKKRPSQIIAEIIEIYNQNKEKFDSEIRILFGRKKFNDVFKKLFREEFAKNLGVRPMDITFDDNLLYTVNKTVLRKTQALKIHNDDLSCSITLTKAGIYSVTPCSDFYSQNKTDKYMHNQMMSAFEKLLHSFNQKLKEINNKIIAEENKFKI